MSKKDFERGKVKGTATAYKIMNAIPWKLVGFVIWSLIAYYSGVSSVGVCP